MSAQEKRFRIHRTTILSMELDACTEKVNEINGGKSIEAFEEVSSATAQRDFTQPIQRRIEELDALLAMSRSKVVSGKLVSNLMLFWKTIFV